MTQIIQDAEEDTQFGKYLTFLVDGDVFAIEIRHTTEILGIQPIVPLPEAPSYVKGVINVRGTIFPVIDMRLRLNKPQADYGERTCVILINFNSISAGLIVDQVLEVVKIDDADIDLPPKLSGKLKNNFVKGIGKTNDNVEMILSCEKLFGDS